MKNQWQSISSARMNHKLNDEQVFQVVYNLKQQILCYQSALKNAEKIINAYREQNQSYQIQNKNLTYKCQQYENKMKELMKNLIKSQERKGKFLQMTSQIQQLNKKLAIYEKTIQILQDKLLILNVAIKKQQYIHKYDTAQTVSPLPQYQLPKKLLKKQTQQSDYTIKTKKFLKNSTPYSVLKKQKYLNTTFVQTPTNSLYNQLNNKNKRVQTQEGELTDNSHSSRTYSRAFKFQ